MSDTSFKTIEQKLVKQVAVILAVGTRQVSPNVPLHTIGVDSLSFVELLVFIEKEYEIKLMESGMTRDDFKDIRSLAKCISKALE